MRRSVVENIRKISKEPDIEGVKFGKIAKIDENGNVFVDFPSNTEGPIGAKITRSIKLQLENHESSVGQDILLVFEGNDPQTTRNY